MTDEKFFERLRRDAAALRYEGDPMMRTRIAARVRERIALAPPTVTQLLARWFRPVAASLAALGLAAAIGLAFVPDNVSSDDTLAFGSNPVEVSVAGDYVE